MAIIIVKRKKLSIWEKTYIPSIIQGLTITLKNLFKKKVTLQYPDERPTIYDGYRGVPTLVMDQNDRQKCVSCQLCEFICPPKAITITPSEIDDEKNSHIQKAPAEFKIDMLRCIYSGLCQEVCPEKAIVLQKTYSMCGLKRNDFLLNKNALYDLGGNIPDKILKWENKK